MKTVSGMDLKSVLETIMKETRPIEGHDDPGAISDCWNEVFETLDSDYLNKELDEAETKAWDALNRYKFQMFGYWSAIWVHLNRISGQARPNPFGKLVQYSRRETGFKKYT